MRSATFARTIRLPALMCRMIEFISGTCGGRFSSTKLYQRYRRPYARACARFAAVLFLTACNLQADQERLSPAPAPTPARGTLVVSAYGAAPVTDRESPPIRHVTTFVRGSNSDALADNDMRGFLDAVNSRLSAN